MAFALFDQMGRYVEEKWARYHFDQIAFSEVARDALESLLLPSAYFGSSPTAILVELGRCANLPLQDLAVRFGQPPVTVYRGQDFVVDVLYWLDGTTSIHDHAFSGAFCVLAGSSIHSRYTFAPAERVNARFWVGDVRLRHIEPLKAGDIRPIEQGRAFIHALFHLDRPSVTVVVRTTNNPDAMPQLRYRRPRLATDDLHRLPLATRALQALNTLASLGDQSYPAVAEDLIGQGDPRLALDVLSDCLHHPWASRFFEPLLDTSGRRFGALGATFGPVVESEANEVRIKSLRTQIWDPQLRNFLAVLLNVPSRDWALRLLAAQAGGMTQARDVLLEQAGRLAAHLLASAEPGRPRTPEPGEERPSVELPAANRLVLRCLLQSRGLEGTIAELSREYGEAEVRAQLPQVVATFETMTKWRVFAPLYQSGDDQKGDQGDAAA